MQLTAQCWQSDNKIFGQAVLSYSVSGSNASGWAKRMQNSGAKAQNGELGSYPLPGVQCIGSEVAGSQPPACSTAEHGFLPKHTHVPAQEDQLSAGFWPNLSKTRELKLLSCAPVRPCPVSLLWEKQKQRITPLTKFICSHCLLKFSCWRSNSVPGCKPAWLSAGLGQSLQLPASTQQPPETKNHLLHSSKPPAEDISYATRILRFVVK